MLPKAWSHTDPLGSRNKVVEAPYKKSRFLRRLFLKSWRQPTLAESIKPLPSARLCLTAEFGKGSGRTTALWPPKEGVRSQNPGVRMPGVGGADKMLKSLAGKRRSLKTAHRRIKAHY